MKRWKPGLPCGESTVIQRTLQTARAAGGRILLVGGERFSELSRLLNAEPDLILSENTEPERGMLSSVQLGIEGTETSRYFVVLGDMPFVRPETYQRLMEAAESGNGNSDAVIAPRFRGKEGHPVLLSSLHSKAISEADPETETLKSVLSHFPKRYVDLDDEGICLDLDTPEDYRRMCGTDFP